MNALAQAMRSRRVVGTFLKLPGPVAVAIAREHFDFVVVDREHSALSEGEALAIIGHGAALGLPTLLRLPTFDSGQVNRALEAGAAGIQLSMVDAAEQVRALRDACEYAPQGRRSVSLGHPGARYGATPLQDYIESSRGGALVVVQLEAVMDPSLYREILEAGPDVGFIGLTDLTVDCGFDQGRLQESIGAIADAAAATETTLGGFGLEQLAQVRYLIVSSDTSMLGQAMAEARSSLEVGTGPAGGRERQSADDDTLEGTK